MKIHLIGVGGAAMGNLAAMLKRSGHKVSGSDHDLYPPMSDRLKEWKIDARPFAPRSVHGKDLIIVGNAISRGNPELEEALRLGLPITSMAAALHDFFLRGKKVIVVAGTHGKTTTTFLTDYLIGEAALGGSEKAKGRAAAGFKGKGSDIGARSVKAEHLPGLFVGGVRADGHPGFRLPGKNSPYFVIEGDEYDTAFFDKASKFLHYRPHHLILTSVEFDHADIFDSLEHYKKAFRILLRWIPANGSLIPCMADAGVRDVCKDYRFSDILGYGSKGHSRARRKGQNVTFEMQDASGRPDLRFECRPSLIGEHNTMNATAAALVARRIGISQEQIVRGLESFPGVLRRQQIRARSRPPEPPVEVAGKRASAELEGKSVLPELIFMEDFAHHPTAVQKTLEAVRQAFPGFRIIALYEPRSATSHRNVFSREYVDSLSGADLVLLPDIFNRNKVPANQRLDVRGIVKGLQSRGCQARYCRDPEGVFKTLSGELSRSQKGSPTAEHRKPVLVLAMSNGGFGGIYPRIDALVRQR